MTGRLIAIDGRWARMGMAIGMALVAVALMGTLPSSAFFDTSISSAPSALTSSSEDLPAGLEAAISATLGDAYLIAPGEGGALEARNPRQDLEARFSAEGIRVRPSEGQWSFDLSLARYGRQGNLLSAPTSQPLALGARVEYEREAFTEWYENGPRGIEQGFTLASPPSGEGLVEFELRRSETLSAALAPDARSVLLSDPQGTLVLRYQDLVAYDAGGQELSARLELGPGTISLLVDDRGAAYPLTIDPLLVTEQAHLFASEGAAGDFFGVSVALAGDTALVGAFFDNTAAGADAGSAYVFVRSGTTWTEQAHLFASDGAANNFFGHSVALAGDTALVGAYVDDTAAGADAGSAYVFVRGGTTWSEEAHLFASDGAAFDFFGFSVALAGDTALVSAYRDNTAGGADAGSAYVFVRSGTTWTEQAHLLASDGAANDWFGFSVALAGDTALVGAHVDDTAAGADAGSAYVFVRGGTTWSEQAHLFASDGAASDLFGRSVALAGATALVGAVGDNTAGGENSGSAYVFVRGGTSWTEQAHLLASDGAADDHFGRSVALAGDTALVGAILDDTASGADAGSAYVFVRSGTTWTEQAHLIASDGAASDLFGGSVALAGDTALVGAYTDDTAGGVNAGSAYVFVLSPAPPGDEVLNHFSCYTLVKTPAVDVIVDLSDQFGTHARRVRHADFLCNPVTKEIEGQVTPPVNANAHLKCYRIVPPEEPKPTRRVEIRNQLTPTGQVIQVNSTREVCAPATKDRPDLDPGQLGLDHFTCYSAVGPSVKKRALLSDQFLSSHSVLVSKAQLLCNPTEKRRADRPGEVVTPQFPNRHLVCYRVEPNPNVSRTVHTEDQFRVENTTALVLKYLCVPSEKRVV